jgi:AcrR family transcriptional regulator
MKVMSKLSSEERRAAIIQAVRRVFAEKGFHGTTTRELAKEAGVSEALLFKHFPNKEALYSAMQISCCERNSAKVARMKALEPSASTLVLLVHMLVSHLVRGPADDDEALRSRLLLRSLTDDGEFARLFFQGMPTLWNRKVEDCIKAAVAVGEATDGRVRPALAGWFAHHLATMIAIHLRCEARVVNYAVPPEKLIEQATWFVLRGMGLGDDAIRRHYNPKTLALLEA